MHDVVTDLLSVPLKRSLADLHASITAGHCAPAGRPFWVSYTIEDSKAGLLRSGESLADAVERVVQLPGLEAVLLNCSAPQVCAPYIPGSSLTCSRHTGDHHGSSRIGIAPMPGDFNQ